MKELTYEELRHISGGDAVLHFIAGKTIKAICIKKDAFDIDPAGHGNINHGLSSTTNLPFDTDPGPCL